MLTRMSNTGMDFCVVDDNERTLLILLSKYAKHTRHVYLTANRITLIIYYTLILLLNSNTLVMMMSTHSLYYSCTIKYLRLLLTSPYCFSVIPSSLAILFMCSSPSDSNCKISCSLSITVTHPSL